MSFPDDRFDAWKKRPGPGTLAPLLEATQDRIFNICFQVLRHREDAEEAKQEVLLEITSGIGAVADAAHFERWVGKVAFRTALDKRRMRLRRTSHENHAAGRVSNGNGPDDALHEGMSRLDEEDRVLLIERYFDRRTLQEVGDRRGISAVAARKRIEKAREQLKRMLGGAVVLLPGHPISDSLFGQVLSKGVLAMKLKTIANAVAIVVVLSIFGGGAWIVLRPPDANAPPLGKSRPTRASETRAAELVNAPAVRIPTPGLKAELPVVGKSEVYPPGHWSRMLQVIDRIAVATKRIPQLKTESREALTEEEGIRLQREARALEDAVAADFEELKGLITQDPGNALKFVATARGNLTWTGFVSLIKATLDAEIESESSTSGPLMTGLLGLASGDAEDKRMFLELARGMARANRMLGEASLRLLADGDPNVRQQAAGVLASHARQGQLKSYLLENSATLRQAATTILHEADCFTRAHALSVLAAIGTPENDDFVLQQFEALNSSQDTCTRLEAILHVAPRIAGTCEARLHASLLRALNLPFYPHCHSAVIGLALYLPREQCLGVLRIAATKLSDEISEGEVRVEMLIREVEAGRQVALRESLEKMNQATFTNRSQGGMVGPTPARAVISR